MRRYPPGRCDRCGTLPQRGARCDACREKAAKRKREVEEKNRLEGKCSCGEILVDDFKSCLKCRVSCRKYYQKKKEAGLCNCGRPVQEGKRSCGDCLESKYRQHYTRRQQLKKDGLCIQCAKRPSVTGSLCNICLGKKRKREYGISEEDFNSLLVSQNYVCAVCKLPNSDSPLNVDHDHFTGRVRGLLCRGCNLAIGFTRENSVVMRLLADYIERHAFP